MISFRVSETSCMSKQTEEGLRKRQNSGRGANNVPFSSARVQLAGPSASASLPSNKKDRLSPITSRARCPIETCQIRQCSRKLSLRHGSSLRSGPSLPSSERTNRLHHQTSAQKRRRRRRRRRRSRHSKLFRLKLTSRASRAKLYCEKV